MDFSEKHGFDSDSIALNDRIEALASSENVSYQEALNRLISRTAPQKTASTDFDEASTRLAEKIQKVATEQNLTFNEAFDRISQEAASFTELDADAAFEKALELV